MTSEKCFEFYTKLNKCYIKFIWVISEIKSKTLTNPLSPIETFPHSASFVTAALFYSIRSLCSQLLKALVVI